MNWTAVISILLLNLVFTIIGTYALIMTFGWWGTCGLYAAGLATAWLKVNYMLKD